MSTYDPLSPTTYFYYSRHQINTTTNQTVCKQLFITFIKVQDNCIHPNIHSEHNHYLHSMGGDWLRESPQMYDPAYVGLHPANRPENKIDDHKANG